MTTRKLIEAVDERPAKRTKIGESNDAASFEDLNRDCLVQIHSFLENEERNAATLINKPMRYARMSSLLSQIRTGTIDITPAVDKSILELYDAIETRGYQHVFADNRTNFKLKNLDNFKHNTAMKDIKRRARSSSVKLPGVKSLDVSFPPHTSNRRRPVKNSTMKALALILPNLESIDLSYMQVTQTAVSAFCQQCPNLKSITWRGSTDNLLIGGEDFKSANNLKDLNLDNSVLYHGDIPLSHFGDDSAYARGGWCMLVQCRRLERLSIKGISATLFRGSPQAVSNDVIAKYVRHAPPTLRWLRSDLSQDYVAMLKQERPEITFVSE